MPIRFSTQAANADHIREEAEPALPDGFTGDVGADGTPRDRTAPRERKGSAARDEQDKSTAGKPGKDENAASFVKDRDAGKP